MSTVPSKDQIRAASDILSRAGFVIMHKDAPETLQNPEMRGRVQNLISTFGWTLREDIVEFDIDDVCQMIYQLEDYPADDVQNVREMLQEGLEGCTYVR